MGCISHSGENNQVSRLSIACTMQSIIANIVWPCCDWFLIRPESHQADQGGATPLFVAAQNGHVDNVEVLLKHGAAVDKAHPPPIHAKNREDSTYFVQFLRPLGPHPLAPKYKNLRNVIIWQFLFYSLYLYRFGSFRTVRGHGTWHLWRTKRQ